MTAPSANAQAITVLTNDSLEILIADLGGQIVSLQSRATCYEWLWKNPHIPRRITPASLQDFGPYDTGGWDEVFPTVTPCTVPHSPWGDRLIADHAELKPKVEPRYVINYRTILIAIYLRFRSISHC